MNMDPVLLTILFILLAAIIGALIRGRIKDKCLKAFHGFLINYEDTAGKRHIGIIRVESTGFELQYPEKQKTESGHVEGSFILYKYEYGNIQALIRYHDELTEENLRVRAEELEKVYHPAWWRRWRRKIMNFFKTIRDSILEVSNVLMSHAKKISPAGAVLTTQEKYVNQVKNEIVGTVETSYEPMLEYHIGQTVLVEFLQLDKQIELSGVLKDYTSEFIELLNVDYPDFEGLNKRKADVLVPRKRATVRHIGE